MIRDTDILDYLSGLSTERFSGTVYRATRTGLNPTTPSTSGGRWMLRESTAVLYTSTVRDGAMAELSFHLGMLTPLPAKQMVLHGLQIETKKTIRIGRKDFLALGIDDNKFAEIAYDRAQLIGDAAAFLGYDGILVPSARWTCENLVVICDNHDISLPIDLVSSEDVDWQAWARAHGFITTP